MPALGPAAGGFAPYMVGDATGIRIDQDPLVIVNMSVWQSVEALWAFVHGEDHLAVMRRRREWFRPRTAAYSVLWWIDSGHEPSVAEGMARLAELNRDGPTARAFTFKRAFDANARPYAPVRATASSC